MYSDGSKLGLSSSVLAEVDVAVVLLSLGEVGEAPPCRGWLVGGFRL